MSKQEKPKKRIGLLRWLRVLAAVVVVVAVALLLLIDPLCRILVARGGTYALGVETTLDRVDVGLLSGRTRIEKLTIHNPTGFDTPHFFQLDTGRIAVTLPSLIGDETVISQLVCGGIRMNLEQKGDRANYKVIIDHLSRFAADDPPQNPPDPPPPSHEQQPKRLVIKKLSLTDIEVNVDLLPVGGRLTRVPVKIDKIELENIGSENRDHPLVMELSGIVIKSILTEVAESAGDVIPDQIATEIENGLQQLQGVGHIAAKLTEDLKEGVEDVGEQLGETGQQIADQLENVGKQVGQGLEDLLNFDEAQGDPSP